MDPYDLPDEFSNLQAQDMSKLGFMQDLIRGIKKLTKPNKNSAQIKETSIINNNSNANINALIDRAMLALEDKEFEKADEFCEQALNQDARNPIAYLAKLMAEYKVSTKNSLASFQNFLIVVKIMKRLSVLEIRILKMNSMATSMK